MKIVNASLDGMTSVQNVLGAIEKPITCGLAMIALPQTDIPKLTIRDKNNDLQNIRLGWQLRAR
jgi:hypothetical protein